MEMIDRRVTHKRFGIGTIKSCEGNVVRVFFDQHGARAFRYPEAFEEFLTAEDGQLAQAVGEDLARWQAERATEAVSRQISFESRLNEARVAKKPAAKKPAAKKAAPKKAAPKKAAPQKAKAVKESGED